MDERLTKALEFSSYMITLNTQKRIIKEKYQESLVHFTNGNQFTITKELVNFVSFLVNSGNDENIILVDDNDIPVNIENLNQFLEDILDVYFTTTNDYYREYLKLKSSRTVEKLTDNDI